MFIAELCTTFVLALIYSVGRNLGQLRYTGCEVIGGDATWKNKSNAGTDVTRISVKLLEITYISNKRIHILYWSLLSDVIA